MPVLDERGRLFGLVNVVDALVVLVVLGVVAAGVLVVVSGDDGTTDSGETRYATIVADNSDALTGYIEVGDTLSTARGGGGMTVTDKYTVHTSSDTTRTYLQIRYDTASKPKTRFGVFASGAGASFRTDGYRTGASILRVNQTSATLPVEETNATIEADVSPRTADSVDQGDTYTTANRTLLTLNSVTKSPSADNETTRVTADVTLRTITLGDALQFASERVVPGRPIPLITDEYWLSGTVVSVESDR